VGSAPPAVPTNALAGRGIVITRPAEQALRLGELVRAAAGHPIFFPTLEIVEPRDTERLDRLIDELERFDWAIFVSPTAASKGLARIRARRALPAGLRVAAMGPGTARELHRLGVEEVLTPERGSDSEALLRRDELADMRNRAVVIFRGFGGRELLARALTERGAIVEYAQCYRRVRPEGGAEVLLRAWERGEVDAIIVTSQEGLGNLQVMVGESGRRRLNETPLFVPHVRIARTARTLGIAHVIVAEAGDEGMVSALSRYFAQTS
jgi:uroporphyrinogen-III synthase